LNVQRHISRGSDKRPPGRDGRSDRPIIASALVLAAVFVPVAFAPGITSGFIVSLRHHRRLLRVQLSLR
jgi:multidrug efflux pump subunit AcrB